MADIFLRSTTGSDGNAGTDKGAPKATLVSALAAAGAAGNVYVSSLHAETQAGGMILQATTTVASPNIIRCVPDWGAATGTAAPTASATGATVTVSGNANIDYRGNAHCYGVTFKSAGTVTPHILCTSGATNAWEIEGGLVECTAAAATEIRIGSDVRGFKVDFNNTPVKFASATGFIGLVGGGFRWRKTVTAVQGTPPTTLFIVPTFNFAYAEIEGVDLSALGSGCNIVSVGSASSITLQLRDCKLGASVALTLGTVPARGIPFVSIINSDSTDTNYRYFQQSYEGSETQETIIVRSSGASDGSTTVSRKIVTTAGAKTVFPYESAPVEFWNEVTGSPITVSIPVLTDAVTLTDAEAWIEVEYLGVSGFPLGTFASDRVSDPIFGAPANQPTDSASSWTTTGLGSPVKQTLDVTFTPQEKGIVRVRVMVARASTTVYYDPKGITGSARQYQSAAGFVNEGPAGLPMSRVFGGL